MFKKAMAYLSSIDLVFTFMPSFSFAEEETPEGITMPDNVMR